MRLTRTADAARAIRAVRLARGLTQRDLAEAVGIARQSLARIERGSGGAAFDTYLSLFEALGIGLEFTASATADEPRSTGASDPPAPVRRSGRPIAEATTESDRDRLRRLRSLIEGHEPTDDDETSLRNGRAE